MWARYVRGCWFRSTAPWHLVPRVLTDPSALRLPPPSGKASPHILPRELHRVARAHPRECYRAMFDASAATLRELASNPKHVGSSNLGFSGVLHT